MHVCHGEIRRDDLLPLPDMDWYTLSLVVMADSDSSGFFVVHVGQL